MVNYPTPKQFIPFVFDWCQVQDPTTGAYYFSSECVPRCTSIVARHRAVPTRADACRANVCV